MGSSEQLMSEGLLVLNEGCLLHILSFLSPRQVCAAATVCKQFAQLAEQPVLWQQFYEQELQHVKSLLPSASQVRQDSTAGAWQQLVRKGLSLRDLRVALWEELRPTAGPARQGSSHAVRPCAREGHAASSWGQNSFILFGGWGSGIRNDLFLLERDGEDDEFKWRALVPAGVRPVIRYGHTATRCGQHGDMLFIFGGMQAGGYHGEIEEPAVLRPRTTPGRDATTAEAPAGPESNSNCEYEWYEPVLKGAQPGARGYHAAAASPDGRLVYLFGGMAEHDCCNTLAVVDVETWQCEVPTTHGTAPLPRFGCSMAVWGGGLWVVGGGHGNDLARSGYDLRDVWRLDLATMTWCKKAPSNPLKDPRVLGRCHAYCLVGSKLVLFGGSLELSNSVTWLDLETCSWGQPTVLGRPPSARMSAVMALSGQDLIIYGGWIYSQGEKGDVYLLKCDLVEDERSVFRDSYALHLQKQQHAETGGKGAQPGQGRDVSDPGCNIGVGPSRPSTIQSSCNRMLMQTRSGSRNASEAGTSRGHAGVAASDAAGNDAEGSISMDTATFARLCSAVPTDEQERAGQGALPRGLLRAHAGTLEYPSSQPRAGTRNSRMAQYFQLIREVHAAQGEGEGGVEEGLMQRMQWAMPMVRFLRTQLLQSWDDSDEDSAGYTTEEDEEEDEEEDADVEGGDEDEEDDNEEEGEEGKEEEEGKGEDEEDG